MKRTNIISEAIETVFGVIALFGVMYIVAGFVSVIFKLLGVE